MLHVWQASGKEIAAIGLEELHDVRTLKTHLQSLCGVPRFRQMLLHNGRSLDEDFKLDSCLDVQLVLLSFPCEASAESGDELIRSVRLGPTSAVEAILHRPQDPNWENDVGQTALVVAADEGFAYAAAMLIEARADPDLQGSAEGGLESMHIYIGLLQLHVQVYR